MSRLFCKLVCIVLLGSAMTVIGQDKPYTSLPYTPSLDTGAMDRSVRACDDLYRFSCGGWQKNNPIPADQSRWSVYGKTHVENQRYLWGLLEQDAVGGAERNPTQKLIGDYFAACMDTATIEQAGLQPLAADMTRIDALQSKSGLAALLAALHASSDSDRFFFGVGAYPDLQDSQQVIGWINSGGIGLPDRDYYLESDPKSVATRDHYRTHIERMLRLYGSTQDEARDTAETVMRIETALARATLSQVEQRDPNRLDNRRRPAQLQQLAPAIDWPAYFDALPLRATPWLNISEPAHLSEINALIGRESLADIKRYLRWVLLDTRAALLGALLAQAGFEFHEGYLRGVPQQPPRWKRCVGLVDAQLGEALGREFVERNFPPEVRGQILTMARQIQDAMRRRLEELDWMSAETRAQALLKLESMRNKIGHPEQWRDYSALQIGRDDFSGNVQRATRFEMQRQLAKIGQPVDHTEWHMSPATVNAYYDPQLNNINFPAGVLMPPLYDPRMDDAPNYGNTGGTIGHELIHGFDDSGRKFDQTGNLRDWWQKNDAEHFEQNTDCVRDQYAQYLVVDELHINSKLTAGEDIADLGGLILAWEAWQAQTRLREPQPRDGLSPEQRFFVGFAQWACSNDRPEELRINALTNPHSPMVHRINGVVVNMPEFSRAFGCKAGDALYREPARMCRVW